jgi:hypothetical protein
MVTRSSTSTTSEDTCAKSSPEAREIRKRAPCKTEKTTFQNKIRKSSNSMAIFRKKDQIINSLMDS